MPAMLATTAQQQGTAGQPQSTSLTPGTTLLAQRGETIQMQLTSNGGNLTLTGPGALVVKEAEVGRLLGDHRLTLEMPSGSVKVYFGPEAPPHVLNIVTPQATIRLTGTLVEIQANPLMTQVIVWEGEAEIHNHATGVRETIVVGQMAQIQAGWMRIQYIAISGSEKTSGTSDALIHTPKTVTYER